MSLFSFHNFSQTQLNILLTQQITSLQFYFPFYLNKSTQINLKNTYFICILNETKLFFSYYSIIQISKSKN